MTFVWRHPSYYKKLKEEQKTEEDPGSDNNQDKDTDPQFQDPQPDN